MSRILPTLLLALLTVPPAAAQEPPCEPPAEEPPAEEPFWEPTYAPGTNWANDFAFDPRDPSRVLMAGLNSGPMQGDPYLSEDGGRTWSSGSGIPGHPLAVEISPADPATLYAASGVVVFRSIDGGGLWCETARLSAVVLTLLVDEREPHTVWAGLANGRVARSDDDALTWAESGQGLTPDRAVNALVAGASPDDLVAATAAGAFRSSDGGRTWTASGTGTVGGGPLRTGTTVLSDLAQDPRVPRVLYAVQPPGGGLATDCLLVNTTYAYCLTGHLYRSDDTGRTWQEIEIPVGPTNGDRPGGNKCVRYGLVSAALTPSGTLVVSGFCGVWTSRDGGESWTYLADVPGSARVAKVEAGPGGDVWAATDGQGVFVSRDDALSFERAAPGWAGSIPVDGGNVCTLAPLGGGHLVASCGLNRLRAWFHTIRSSDGGRTWQAVEGLREGHVLHFARDARYGNVVLAATKTEGFLRSTDWGRTWKAVAALPPSAIGVVADPVRSGSFYAAASAAQALGLTPIYGESIPGGLWRSRDGGVTWSLVGLLPAAVPYALAVSPSDPNVLFMGAWSDPFTDAPEGGLWRSDDAGLTWTLVPDVPAGHTTNAIGFVAGDPKVVLASSNTLYRSTDGGRTFAAVAGMPQNVWAFPRSFATATGLPGVVYYGTDTQLLRSGDGGAAWETAESGIEAHDVEGTRAVLADPDDPGGFYVLAGGYGWPWGTRFGSYGRFLFRGSEA